MLYSLDDFAYSIASELRQERDGEQGAEETKIRVDRYLNGILEDYRERAMTRATEILALMTPELIEEA